MSRLHAVTAGGLYYQSADSLSGSIAGSASLCESIGRIPFTQTRSSFNLWSRKIVRRERPTRRVRWTAGFRSSPIPDAFAPPPMTRIVRRHGVMRIFRRTRQEWLSFLLFPFRAYVVAAPMCLFVWLSVTQEDRIRGGRAEAALPVALGLMSGLPLRLYSSCMLSCFRCVRVDGGCVRLA